jgi:hypothetical protein
MGVVNKLKTLEMEVAIASYFNPRRNLVVPNISWGLSIHECDLFVLTASDYAYEVEIKVSLNDLKKDCEKVHQHIDLKNRIRKLFYAVPHYLLPIDEYIPDRAGILSVIKTGNIYHSKLERPPKIQKTARCLTKRERDKVTRLGAMRIWGLKKKLCKLTT